MAFTWEVEALRKILDTILEGGEAQEKKSDAAIRDERIAREQFELGPDDPLPARWEVDSDGLAWDLTPFDWQEEQREKARKDRQVVGDIESENRGRSPAIDAFLDALSNVPADEAKSRGVDLQKHDQNMDYLRGRGKTNRIKREEKDKLKLDWVNEILQEFPEDKAPEVLRLPQWKDEEKKPDMSPFLSYLLRQSPYARLPAAGLLGLGLMGYSKPAY